MSAPSLFLASSRRPSLPRRVAAATQDITISIGVVGPTPPTALIYPKRPLVTQDLICLLLPGTVGEGLPELYEFTWSNGIDPEIVHGPKADTEDILPASHTEVGDTWTCVARTFDGSLYSTPSNTATAGPVAGVGESSLTLSVFPSTLTIGQPLVLTAAISPEQALAPVHYDDTETPPGGADNKPAPQLTNLFGVATQSFLPDEAGLWNFIAAWPGNETYSADSDSKIVTVLKAQPAITLSLSHGSASAGFCELSATATISMGAGWPFPLASLLEGLPVRITMRSPTGASLQLPPKNTGADGAVTFTPADFDAALDAEDGAADGAWHFNEAGSWKFIAVFDGNGAFFNATSPNFDLPNAVLLTIRDGAGYAVISVGRIRSGEGMFEHAKTADLVDRAFRERGFGPQDIYYLRPGMIPRPPWLAPEDIDDLTPSPAGLLSFNDPVFDGVMSHGIRLGFGLNAGESIGWLAASGTIILPPAPAPMTAVSAESQTPVPPETEAWIEIKTPLYAGSETAIPGDPAFQRIVDLPEFYYEGTLPSDGVFTWPPEQIGDYFNSVGAYQIFYFVKDGSTKEVSSHLLTTVYRQSDGNLPPSTPELVFPPDDAIIDAASFFTWTESSDPEAGGLTYTIEFADESDIPFSLILAKQEGLVHTIALAGIADGLMDGAHYRWRVKAIDAQGAEAVSNARTLMVDIGNTSVNGAISGIVKDSVSGLAISGAAVSLSAGAGPTATNRDGKYYFLNLPSGQTYTVTAEARNYDSDSVNVNVSSGSIVEPRALRLTPAALGEFRWGDLDGDGIAGALDVSEIERWWNEAGFDVFGVDTGETYNAGACPLPRWTGCSIFPPGGDVFTGGSSANRLEAQDVAEILKFRAGVTSQFPVDTDGNGWGPEAKRAAARARGGAIREIAAPMLDADPGETITVDIAVDDASGVESFELILDYNPSRLTPLDVVRGGLTSAWTVLSYFIGPDQIFITGANAVAAQGSGVSATVLFEVSESATGLTIPLALSQATLTGGTIATSVVHGAVSVTGGAPEDVNGDGVVNAQDVQLVILGALDIVTPGVETDINQDGVTNATDVQLVILGALR